MNHDIFISYSSKQKNIADGVCHYLEENGFKCWMAPRDIPAGSDYGDLIDSAIKQCEVTVLVFSEAASVSKWVKGEINIAFSNDKPILPFRVDNTQLTGALNLMLNQMHWIDAYPQYAERLPDLLSSISGLLGRRPTKLVDKKRHNKKFDFFISHVSEDNDLVRKMVKRLNDNGINRIWVDFDKTEDDTYWDRIIEGIANSACFLPVLTNHYLGKIQSKSKQSEAFKRADITELNININVTDCLKLCCDLDSVQVELLLASKYFKEFAQGVYSIPIIQKDCLFMGAPLSIKFIEELSKNSCLLPENLFYGLMMLEFDGDDPDSFVMDWDRFKSEAELKNENVNNMPLAFSQKHSVCPEGAINGIFSVSLTKEVYFSKGNLQYRASTGEWRFATRQFDIIGDGNKFVSNSYRGWIDLFCWGWGDRPTNRLKDKAQIYRHLGERMADDSFVDWGVNRINNGGNQEHMWYTLTAKEWSFLLNERQTLSGIRYAMANVKGLNGLLLFPDDWNVNYYSLENVNRFDIPFDANIIAASKWPSLEKVGVVFLPAAGYCYGTEVGGVGHFGLYWSASYLPEVVAFRDEVPRYNPLDMIKGQSVRLVCLVTK